MTRSGGGVHHGRETGCRHELRRGAASGVDRHQLTGRRGPLAAAQLQNGIGGGGEDGCYDGEVTCVDAGVLRHANAVANLTKGEAKVNSYCANVVALSVVNWEKVVRNQLLALDNIGHVCVI